jgi:hypothetical protein
VLVLAVLMLGLGAVGAVWAARLLDAPEETPAPADPAAGFRVQARIAQLLLREAGLQRRGDPPLTVTAADLNAFLDRHVLVRRAGLSAVRVRFDPGEVTVHGRTTLDRLLAETGPAWLSAVLPGVLGRLPVWLMARGRLELAGGRGRFVIEQAAVGRQPVSRAVVERFVPPEVLGGWRAPRVIDRIEVEPGRLVVHTRP